MKRHNEIKISNIVNQVRAETTQDIRHQTVAEASQLHDQIMANRINEMEFRNAQRMRELQLNTSRNCWKWHKLRSLRKNKRNNTYNNRMNRQEKKLDNLQEGRSNTMKNNIGVNNKEQKKQIGRAHV